MMNKMKKKIVAKFQVNHVENQEEMLDRFVLYLVTDN